MLSSAATRRFFLSACLGIAAATTAGAAEPGDLLKQARALIARHEAEVRPLEIEAARCWWDANITGRDDAFRKKEAAETRLELRLADAKTFAELKTLRAAKLTDPIVARQIDLLHLQYLGRQVDPALLKQIPAVSNGIEKAFNVYRPKLNGREVTDNVLRRVLRDSKDLAERQAAWEAGKNVGPVIEKELKKLVRLRNQAARQLGFHDYHEMQLALNEQNRDEIFRLFDELDAMTREPYRRVKAEIDVATAAKLGVAKADLRPWHYPDPFFQTPPDVFGRDTSSIYASVDVVAVCRKFYRGIGLPVDDVLERSDLYEKPGKNSHAFCIDVDRNGDVRIFGNVVADHRWLGTTLHELGHSVYSSKNIPAETPYVLRTDAHPLATEAVAMMYERFADRAEWLQAMGVNVPDPDGFNEAARRQRRAKLLVFSRWCQVMLRFEKEMYSNPDQDLNALWRRLVETYQGLKYPEGRNAPDYGAKLHIVAAPAYYHNYMMGELLASQLHRTIMSTVLGEKNSIAVYADKPAAGEFMKTRVFIHGRKLPWNEMVRRATGEPLNPAAFTAELTGDSR